MGLPDDFKLWERELREPSQETSGTSERGMLVAASFAALGCTIVMVLGHRMLGAAGLVLSALILLLWRAGM